MRAALVKAGPATDIAASIIRAEKLELWLKKVRIGSVAVTLSACICFVFVLVGSPVLVAYRQARAISSGDERAYVATLFAANDEDRLHLHIRAARMQAEWELKNEVRNRFGKGAVRNLEPFLLIKPVPWIIALGGTSGQPMMRSDGATWSVTNTPAGWRQLVPLQTETSLENEAMTSIFNNAVGKLRANSYGGLDELLSNLNTRFRPSLP